MSGPSILTDFDASRLITVGIGEMAISSDPRALIIVPNLGSCLAVVAYDRKVKLGGAIHCLLPLSNADSDHINKKPSLYVDTGVPIFLKELIDAGANKKDLEIFAAGCASINDANSVFEIGKKNHIVFRRLMWRNSLLISGEEIGGSLPRTIHLRIATGAVTTTTQGKVKRIGY